MVGMQSITAFPSFVKIDAETPTSILLMGEHLEDVQLISTNPDVNIEILERDPNYLAGYLNAAAILEEYSAEIRTNSGKPLVILNVSAEPLPEVYPIEELSIDGVLYKSFPVNKNVGQTAQCSVRAKCRTAYWPDFLVEPNNIEISRSKFENGWASFIFKFPKISDGQPRSFYIVNEGIRVWEGVINP